MKNSLRLFLLLCLLLAISSLSAANSTSEQRNYTVDERASPSSVPIIDLLQDGEQYEIEILSIGCFNGSKQLLTIFRKEDSYTLQFRDTIKELNASEINAIRDFELKLQSLSMGGCSTVDTYKLVYGGNSFQISDGTCSFNGGRKLMELLGLTSSK